MSDRDGDYDIYTMNQDGSGVFQVTNDPADDINPAWSPDGTKIAFASSRTVTAYDIFVVNANGIGAPTQLTETAGDDTTPSWSPDGTQIAFTSTRNAGVDDIYKMNADGTGGTDGTRMTMNPRSDSSPAWSPDGSKIVFRSDRFVDPEENCDGSGPRYWEMMMTDPDPPYFDETEFTHNDCPYEVEMTWAPDGSKIAYQVNPPGVPNIEVFTINSDGTNDLVNLTNSPGNDGWPSWSHDGSMIAFGSNRDGDFEVYSMSATGGPATPLTNNDFDDFDPDWQRLFHYARPQGASPFRASLVPAQKQCLFPDNTHGAPAAFASCSSPKPQSGYLTVGTFPANGNAAQGTGQLRVDVINAASVSQDDQLTVSLTDVRCRGTSGGCAGAMEDYTGTLLANVTFRITDTYNGSPPDDPATVLDFPFTWSVPCAATGTPGIPNAIGSTCASVTTANALVPGFVKFGQRQMIELGQAQVFDGGADGSAATGGDNSLYQIQGIFNP